MYWISSNDKEKVLPLKQIFLLVFKSIKLKFCLKKNESIGVNFGNYNRKQGNRKYKTKTLYVRNKFSAL